MQKTKFQVLSTRPLSKQLTDQAALRNIELFEISLIETIRLNAGHVKAKIEDYLQKNVIAAFTSMNAVDAVVKYVKRKPCWNIYCIGTTTNGLVSRYFGKDSIAGTANNAEELAKAIIRDNVKEVIFFCGNQRREELPGILKANNIAMEEVVVYNTVETPVQIKKKYDGILFFSPSAVHSFFSMNQVGNDTQLFAIGPTTAKAIQQYVENNVMVSGFPAKENVVMQMIEHFCG